jgi:hypothetical protein
MWIGSDGSQLNVGTAQAQNLSFSTNAFTAMTIDTSQRVGIGTTSPATALNVQASAGEIVRATVSSNTGLYANIGADGNGGWFGSNADLRLLPSGTERARIDSSGRLLVGTSSTSVISTAVFSGRSDAAASALVRIQTSDTAPASGANLGMIAFGTAGTSSVNSSAFIIAERDGGTWTNNSSMPGRLVFSVTGDGAASPTERMRIGSDGRVQIGATNALYSATLTTKSAGNPYNITSSRVGAGTGSLGHVVFETDTGAVGTIFTNGASTQYNTSSDYRLKENVTAVTEGITRLLQLNPRRFNFIADPDRTVDGFIAHEAQAIVPECVTGDKDAVDEDGNPVYQGIDQSKLVPLLTAALQEAIAKIEILEVRLTALETA